MELLVILLPVMAFIALASGLVVVFRGSGRIAARTRELNQFKAAVRDLTARADSLLATAADQIDAVRHQQAGPDQIGRTVADATASLERFGEEARAWSGRAQGAGHPRRSRGRARAGGPGARDGGARRRTCSPRRDAGARDLEAQTSIKRGYLNLIHAREAIARQAIRAEDLMVDEARGGPAAWAG